MTASEDLLIQYLYKKHMRPDVNIAVWELGQYNITAGWAFSFLRAVYFFLILLVE